MLLQEPPESQYDLRFQLFDFPIRVAWTFWLGTLVFGWGLVDGMDYYLSRADDSPGRLPLLILWAICMLVSIIIHELGHAFAHRYFGMRSAVVLYHFGGLAIPSGGGSARFRPVGTRAPNPSAQQLIISAAGPAAQLASAALVLVGFKLLGFRLDGAYGDGISFVPFLDRLPGFADGEAINNGGLFALMTFYTLPSVFWAVLNLAPVIPLDGGRIMQSVVRMTGGREHTAYWISLITAGLGAWYGFTSGSLFLGILCVSFAISNYQMIQGLGRW
ncbi:MAG: site-2 protease family protein [Planctomycetota bacterium]